MKRSLALLSLAPFAVLAAGPFVSQPTFDYDEASGLATITYRLSDETGIVTMDVKTNGVTIGAANYAGAWGDVWQRVRADSDAVRTIWWRPRGSWGAIVAKALETDTLTVEVTARPLDDPPAYLVANLSSFSNLLFYTSLDLLPGGTGVTNVRYKTDWVVMRRIPAAGVTWRMGRADEDTANRNRDYGHMVTLSEDYYLAVFETTREQVSMIQTSGYSSLASDVDFKAEDGMTYDGLRGSAYDFPRDGHDVAANSFLGRLRERTGVLFDLPTDAQWEFACRTGKPTLFSTGRDDTTGLGNYCWYTGSVSTAPTEERPLPVGLLKPNDWGLYDMHGNVWELCNDWCVNELTAPALDPTGPEENPGTGKIMRGGDYSKAGTYIYASHRNYTSRTGKLGFRLWCPLAIPDLPTEEE